MRILRFTLILLFPVSLAAQTRLYTIVSPNPVVSGESFQVQFVLENADRSAVVQAPSWKPFREVAGPRTYAGTEIKNGKAVQVKNIVYTLEAGVTGTFTIPGATANNNGSQVQGAPVRVQVVRKTAVAPAAQPSLPEGAALRDLVRKNFYLRATVNKSSCYVGEPVEAVFSLYSSLEAKSSIVKYPGFYGFSIVDMITVNDHFEKNVEIDGKPFTVHTLRKVQLFPLQAGNFTIDAMEMKGEIRFLPEGVSPANNQDIAEGMLGDPNHFDPAEGGKIEEVSLRSDPIAIKVLPLPANGKSVNFEGAVGQFLLNAAISADTLNRNEQGSLLLTCSGKGNFTQLNAPDIQWPEGIEGFTPVVNDAFDKNSFPLSGNRTFRYAFVGARPGDYTLPPVLFSFFDPASGTYKTVQSPPVRLTISATEKKAAALNKSEENLTSKGERKARIGLLIVISLVVSGLIFYATRRKKTESVTELPVRPAYTTVQELVSSLYSTPGVNDANLQAAAYRALSQYLRERLPGLATSYTGEQLSVLLKEKGVETSVADELGHLTHVLELLVYAGISDTKALENLPEKLTQLLQAADTVLLKH